MVQETTSPLYTCPICAQKTPDGHGCSNPLCSWDSPSRQFGKIYTIGYDKGELYDLVRAKLKTNNSLSGLYSVLADYLRDNREVFQEQYDLIIAVPAHPDAVLRRGFDLVSEVCRHAAQRLPPGLSKLFAQQVYLIKTKDTAPTKTLPTYEERRDNVAGAFLITPALSNDFAKKYAGKNVLLVDDVLTTGATINECAKVLRQAGVRRVDGLVLVRASLRPSTVGDATQTLDASSESTTSQSNKSPTQLPTPPQQSRTP